jgi:hypothetical protein
LTRTSNRNIIGDVMMDLKKIQKLRSQIEGLRGRGGIKSDEIESLARRLGRRRAKKGKEPTYVSEVFPDLRPVSIPSHPRDLNRFTAGGILDQLESDLDSYEALLTSRLKESI